MANSVPTFEVVADGPLSDSAIQALAAFLLSLVEQDDREPQEVKEEAQSA